MRLIGCDLHASQQSIAMLDTEGGAERVREGQRCGRAEAGIRLWIMLRDQIDFSEFCRRGQARQS